MIDTALAGAARARSIACSRRARDRRAASALWLASETAKIRLKEIAKRAINPLRGRKRS